MLAESGGIGGDSRPKSRSRLQFLSTRTAVTTETFRITVLSRITVTSSPPAVRSEESMKVTLPSFVRGFALLAAALVPTLEAVAQGPPGSSGTAQVPGTYSHAPAYYDEPFVGYQSQTAFQTANQRDAAMDRARE